MQLIKALSLMMLSITMAFAEDYFDNSPSFHVDDTTRLGACIILMSRNGCDCNSTEETTISKSSTDAGLSEEDQCFSIEDLLDSAALLSDTEKLIFNNWLEKAKKEIIDNPALTKEQVLTNLYHSLQYFLDSHPRIKSAIKFTYNKEWNYARNLHNMIYDIASTTEKNPQLKYSILPNSNGSYPLTDALTDFGKYASAGEQMAISSLVSKTKNIIKSDSPQWLKLVKIYQLFQDSLSEDYRIKNLVEKNCENENKDYSFICSFFDTCPSYYRIDNFFNALNGSLSKCVILSTTLDYPDNKTHTVVPPSIIDEIINHTLTSCPDKETENNLKPLCTKLVNLYNQNNWQDNYTIFNDLCDSDTIEKVRYAYFYCTNGNCNGTTPAGTIKPVTPTGTTKPVTPTGTVKPVTPTGTTKPSIISSTAKPNTNTTDTVLTTTTPGFNCDEIVKFNVYNESANSTILLDAIEKDQANWTPQQVKSFEGYKKRIYNISIDKSYKESEKFKLIRQLLLNFSVSSTTLYKEVHGVRIGNWGSIAQYVACPVPKDPTKK